MFGTDTWADCLVALFFKDAFHSLHRYLYFMENEEDECSEYHPHDTSRYCQFCFDQWHPNQIERPYTNNPVIPLLDSVYDHVIKRYPRRSFCILRNCVRVSDLIRSPTDTCFELTRGPRASSGCDSCAAGGGGSKEAEAGIKTRLRGRGGSRCGCARPCCAGPAVTGPGSGGQASRLTRPGVVRRSVRTLSALPDTERVKSNERWVFANRSPEQSQTRSKTRSGSKSREILSLLGDSGYGSTSVCLEDSSRGVMTRARKRNLVKMSTDSSESLAKRIKVENFSRKSKKNRSSGKFSGKVSFKKNTCSKDLQNVPTTSKPLQVIGEKNTIHYSQWEKDLVKNYEESGCCRHAKDCGNTGKSGIWCEPDSISYREIVGYPHLNECVNSLEILNIGGSNVLGEFIPFLFLHTPKLKSLGQWLNTMIYGLEILKVRRRFFDFC